ncbi:uncharacterized protein LOC143040716 [Oratosquilla oratoria]|uniref:uncharacterized protein LOC143040716 n=1 Tax=Oratosquilla oratoria TaxID=337810 RepID=UPI003F75B8D3
MTMASLSTAATVLVLVLWLRGLSCLDERRCVDIDQVTSHNRSSTVPFHSGMEVEFLYEGLDETSQDINIGFYIIENENQVANVFVLQKINNELKQLKINFRTNQWGTVKVMNFGSPFNVGIFGKVRLEYSGGLFQGVVWDKDRQKNMTWSERAPTEGQGNLTIFARIPKKKKYSSIVYWPDTCPPAPSPVPQPQGFVIDNTIILYMCVIAALTVVSLVLLALLCRQLRTFRQPKVKDQDTGVQRNESSEGRCRQGPPLRHRSQEERGDSEGRDSINSIYGYIPRD